MLNRSASLAMSTSILKALSGKLDIKRYSPSITLVNVNAPVVATTSWWLHCSAPVVALKVKKSIPVDFIIQL